MPPELHFEALTFRVYRGAVLEASGTARRASLRRDTNDLSAAEVRVAFPATPARAESRLAAATVDGNLRARRFVARGGVRAEQADQSATTEEARYAASEGLVRGDRPVEVRGGAFVLRGPGFTLDPRDQIVRVTGGTAGVAGGDAR